MITQHINRSNGVLKIPYRLSNTNIKEVRVVGTNETDFNPNVVLLLRFNSESCSWLEEKKGQIDGVATRLLYINCIRFFIGNRKPQFAVTRLQFHVAEISNFSKALSSVHFISI